ncbi:hypothetical protein RVR_4528 [Actinacidiphila reveromycinica]|uniref:Uncharacterized protein n=1 Tax=Actinacidiphila reveromycinica TaxID=659352 RepID=A0A7U3UT53_9ACTN|nr:hypothetical protein [Streptomyces sp. SN-593]BBA98372.1 hypothetical protein RVR_4528 [Streptomyces sp. SN-593]
MIADYADLGCIEIINSARASVYAEKYCLLTSCEPCPGLPEAISDEPYVDPVTDPAPWYDPAVPESAQFLGVMGLTVAGFSQSTRSRDPVQLVGDGAALGIARRAHREITYTVLLLVLDECALPYALEWLSAALQGAPCEGSCVGDELGVFACCPTGDGTRELRHLYGVGLMTGPEITSARYLDEGIIAEVTFTLAASVPWIYREPLQTLTDWVSLSAGTPVTLDPDEVYGECVEATPCLEDPECPPPPLPVRAPVPVDPCYPTGEDDFYRSVLSLSPVDQPGWLEAVPVLELETGGSALRRLIVRFWANPLGSDCMDVADPCAACTDIQIPYLPPGSTLRVDGRTQRAEVDCPQGPLGSSTSTPTLYGPLGRSFEWPIFSCPTGLCIEILSTEAATAGDARARVLLVPRSDVG